MQPLWSAPVRYAECDQQGVVFNAHYLTWADEACTAFFAAHGTPYAALLARGLDTAVKAATLTWSAPARFGDVVDVECVLARTGRASFTLASTVSVAGAPCCVVETTYVLIDAERRPVRLPADLVVAWG